MRKQLLSLLLTLALLLCAAAGLGEQTPGLTSARISALQKLAGENGAQWREGTPPTPDMNAFQMWQWTDWFLSDTVRSLLGALQDVEQLDSDKSLDNGAKDDQWKLRETENILSRFEAQLEEDRLAIVNGISLCQSDEVSEDERLTAYNRILEAESEIRQIIETICRDYESYLAQVAACHNGLQASYRSYTQQVQSSTSASLAAAAKNLEDSENAANADFRVSVSSTAQFKIQVVGPDQTALQGAQVTVTNQRNTSKTETTSTDAQGNAVFWVGDLGADEKSELRLSVRIKANGCRTQEVQVVKLRAGETRAFHLQRDDGSPYLVMGCFNGRDILTESGTYYCTKKNTLDHTFSVKLHCDRDGELELRYPESAGATEYKTVVKKFTAADSDKTVFKFEDQWLSKLPPGAKVSFTIKSGGKSYTTDTLIDIQKAMVDEPFFSKSALFSFTSGTTGIGFDIPGKIPFISGSRLAFEIPGKLPQVVYTPSYMVMFAWGYDFKPEQANWQSEDAEDQARAIKEFQAKSKADKALAMAGAYRNVNTTTQWKFLGNYGATVTPFVSAQGLYRVSDHSLELRGAAGATLAFQAEATQTFTVGPVPFFAGVDFSMGVSFGLDVTLAMNLDVINGAPKVVKGPEIGYGSGLSISIRLEMGLNGGMGLKNVASIGFRFYGYLNPIVHFTTPRVTADAKLGMGFTVNVRLLFLKWSATIWKGELSLGENAVAPPSGTVIRPVSVSEKVEPVSTSALSVLPDVAADDLQFVQIGTDTYLFWIQPGTTDLTAQLSWHNLNDPQRYGSVTYLQGMGPRPLRQNSCDDYAFAIETEGDYCALTILSGVFPSAGSGDNPTPPSISCVATVLMQRNDGTSQSGNTGNLDMIGYQEGVTFPEGGDYPLMPEVSLRVSGGDVSVVSSYSTARNPETISSQLYTHIDSYMDQTGSKLQNTASLTCADAAEITRYGIAAAPASGQQAAFYALNAKGELSRLTASGNTGSRNVLAQGDIINFRVLTGADSGQPTDRLFYLEQAKTEGDNPVQRLRSVTLDAARKQTDYDIETSASSFDVVRFSEGIYLYWAETTTPDDSANPNNAEGYREEYLVRCVRYDPDTDTVFGPFSLIKLNNCPESIRLQNSGTGFYAVAPESADSPDQRHSIHKFTYTLIRSIELTSAVLSDPCVCAGDFVDLSFTVTNTGSVPISGFEMQIIDKGTNAATPLLVQEMHLDLDNPESSTNRYQTQNAAYTMTGANVARRIGNMYDAVNQEDWTITDATAAGSAVRSVRTDLLMPGDTRSYQTKLQIPADWAGGNTLFARITDVTGEASLSSTRTAEGLLLMGNQSAGSANAAQPEMRISGEVRIDTGAHDLMLTAKLIKHSGEDYVHITIRNRSGSNASAVTPVLTASFRGTTLYSHEFVNAMRDDFGYAMDIPLMTLTQGRRLQELDLQVGSRAGAAYEEFADSDNHVRLLLITQLCIVDQPVNFPATEGGEAVFSVTAAGGDTPYRYQWQRMTGVDQWENIPGANQEVYRIPSVRIEQNGLTVRCVVTDQFGDSVTSDPAALSILPQTGDSSQLTLWLLLALSSAAILTAICRKRER